MFLILGQLLACALGLAALLRKLDRDLVRINEFIFRTSVVPRRLRVLKDQALTCRECLATHRTCDRCYRFFGLHIGSLARFHLTRQRRPRGRLGFRFSGPGKVPAAN